MTISGGCLYSDRHAAYRDQASTGLTEVRPGYGRVRPLGAQLEHDRRANPACRTCHKGGLSRKSTHFRAAVPSLGSRSALDALEQGAPGDDACRFTCLVDGEQVPRLCRDPQNGRQLVTGLHAWKGSKLLGGHAFPRLHNLPGGHHRAKPEIKSIIPLVRRDHPR